MRRPFAICRTLVDIGEGGGRCDVAAITVCRGWLGRAANAVLLSFVDLMCAPRACLILNVRDGGGQCSAPPRALRRENWYRNVPPCRGRFAPSLLNYIYSWIGCPVRTHKKSICRETKRATTGLNTRMKSSHRGAFNGGVQKFIFSFFGELFLCKK